MCPMAEKDRKNDGQSDSIKAMLDRLRRSVTDLPSEENGASVDMQEETPAREKSSSRSPAEEPSEAEDESLILLPWEDEPMEEDVEGDTLDDLPEDSPENDEDAVEVVATADDEDEGEDDPFFAAEVDDDAVAAFFAEENEGSDGQDAPLLENAPLAVEAAPLLEEEVACDSSVFVAEDDLPAGFVDVIDAQRDEQEEGGAQDLPLVTDEEVARLFQSNQAVSEPPAVPAREVRAGAYADIEANEDNGYAVEVEVRRFSQPQMAGYDTEAAPALQPVVVPFASDATGEQSSSPLMADAAAEQNRTPDSSKPAATQGLSNGSTIFRDNGARRRPVEVLETEDADEQPAVADFREFLGKNNSAEKYDWENASFSSPKTAEKAEKKEKQKVQHFGPGVQLTIDDIKKEKQPCARRVGLLSRINNKITKKIAADGAPQEKTQGVDAQAYHGTRRPLNAAPDKRVQERESSAARALAGLYQEEAAAYHEYTSRSQIGLFRRKFESELSFLALRIGILAFLSVLLLFLENGTHWGIPLARLFVAPISMAGLHLLLLFFSLLCCIPLFAHAWRQLFARRVVSELFVAIGLVSALLYGAILCFSLIPSPEMGAGASLSDVHLFGLLPVFAALVSAITEFYKVKNDLASFELISSAGDKLACSVQNGASTRSEAAAVADLREGEQTRIVSVKKVGFTSGFFHRITRNCEDEQKNLWLLPTAAVAALMVAVIVGLLNGEFLSACYAFCVTLALSLPLCTLVLHDLPISTLFRFASANSCAVVGEVSAIEYSDTDAVAFEDVEAFSARGVRVQRIKLYHESALDHVLYQVAGVFSAVGGPLDGVFRNSTAELGLPSDVRLQQVQEGGIVAVVDGRQIYVGNGDFMLKKDVRMYFDAEDEQILANGKTCILYAAEEGQLSAKFYIRYRMKEEFEREVERLSANHIRVIVRTFDPNIRQALIDKISYVGRYDLRVVRKTVEQQNDYAAPQINSGIVTRRSVREILRVLLACRRACRLTSFSEMGGLAIGCIGMLLSIVAAVFGMMLSLPSWAFAVYQLLWVLPVMLASWLYIARK